MISLVPLLRPVLKRIGLDLVPYDHRFHPLARRMKLLQSQRIDVVFDIGANVGQYAQELREHGYRGRIVSFEPLTAEFERLGRACAGDPSWEAIRLAVGDVPGTATINVAANSYSSSLLEMLPAHVESAPESAYVRREVVQVETLAALVPRHLRAGERLLLKIDVQGYERRVLAGAGEALARVQGIQLEGSLVPLYRGETPLLEMMRLLSDDGFQLMAVEPGYAHAETGQLLQADVMFFRAASSKA